MSSGDRFREDRWTGNSGRGNEGGRNFENQYGRGNDYGNDRNRGGYREENQSGRGRTNDYGDYSMGNRSMGYRGESYNDDLYARNRGRYQDEGWTSGNRGGSGYGRSENRGGYQDYYQREERNQYGRGQSRYETMQRSRPSGKDDEGLRKLMTDQLKDMYWAEKALTKALPKMISKASSEDLVEALTEHTQVTRGHVQKLEEIFSIMGEKASAKKCEAMEGLIKEANEITGELEEGSVMDAGIICAAQKVEHYEIATYGCLSTYAEILGEMEAYQLLEEILDEEKEADRTLTEVARMINWEAAEEDDDDEEYEDMEEEEAEEEESDDEDTDDEPSELDAIER